MRCMTEFQAGKLLSNFEDVYQRTADFTVEVLQCPCYTECQEFHKLAELKGSTGFVVYCHRRRAENQQGRQGEAFGSAESKSHDVFILQKNSEVKIKTSELFSELEMKNISCPRCRKTFEHAQELMKQVKSIDGKIVMGICDHCRKKAQSIKKPFCVCDEIVKKFISAYTEQKEEIKKHVKTGLPTTLKKPQQLILRAYSDSQINQGLNSPAYKHEPEVKPMYYSEKYTSDINLNIEMREIGYTKQPVTFLEPIGPMGTPFDLTPHGNVSGTMIPGKSLADDKELPRTSLKDRKQEEIFVDTLPSIDAKEVLKRRHDLSMRLMMGLDKGFGGPYSASKRHDGYESPTIAPWEQKTKHYGSSISQKNVRDSEEKPKKFKKFDQRHFADEELQLQRSIEKISHKAKTRDTQLAKSKSWHKKPHKPKESVESVPKPQFSFFFPKVKEKVENEVKLDVSSSQLIKDTQEKFNQQTEKKRQEEQRQQKIEQDQKKKLAREEKILQAEEKKRQTVEDKKYTERQKRLPEQEQYIEKDFESKLVGEEKRQYKTKRDRPKETFEKDGESAIKGAESKPKQRDKIDKEFDKAKKSSTLKPELSDEISEKAKMKSKPELRDKIDEISDKAKKKSKSEQRDKIDEILEKAKMKSKPELRDKIDEISNKAKKKSKSEQRDKIDEISEKAKTISKHEKENKIDGLLQKTKKSVTDKSAAAQKDNDKVTEQEKSVLKKEPKQKSTDDDLITKTLKAQKGKHGTKDKDDKKPEKEKTSIKEKLEPKDKAETTKKASKSETNKENKIYESKTADKEKGKEVEKEKKKKTADEERFEKIQRENEAKELAELKKLVEQTRKEKEEKKHQLQKEKEEKEHQLRKEKEEKTKGSKDLKSETKKEVKIYESKTADKVKVESERKDKEEEKNKIKAEAERLEKIQRENEAKELAEFKKLIEQLRKEKEEMKQKSRKEKEEKEKLELKLKDKSSKQKSDEPKLTAEQLKEEALKKKQQELEKKKQQELELQSLNKMGMSIYIEKPVMLKMGDVKIQRELDHDDLILRLVRLKQASTRKPLPMDFAELERHSPEKSFSSLYPICSVSEIEVLSLELYDQIYQPSEIITDIVIGEKILKFKQFYEKTKVLEVDAKYRKVFFSDNILPPKEVKIIQEEVENVHKPVPSLKQIEVDPGKGILRYALSDRTFIEKGWTMLPTEKVVRKMNVYRMRPAHPEFDWFEHNKNKRLMTYDSGERLAEFDDNGRGRWYYRSGRLALDYYDAEETNVQQRFVIYSSGEPDERGRTHPITILATFDYLGNGIVFDHSGKIRLKYNQTEGVVLDRGIGPVSHWKWHTLNDPPVLQQVMIDTQMAHKDPHILKLGPPSDRKTRPDNEEMLAIEFDNFIKEKSKKLSQKFKPFQIKMKALKINEHFSLKVLDQATVYLIFRDGSTNLKLNIGMILDHQEIVDTDTAEVGEVSNSLERFPARTDSLAGLQRSVAYAQRYEKQRSNREARLRPAEPCASADQLTAAASRPMRLPLRTVPTGSSSSTGYCSRKPSFNLYYNTRLL